MSTEELQTNTDNKITITIDNETVPITINKIDKQNTYFIIKNKIDTVLHEDIQIDLFLSALNTNSNNENEENTSDFINPYDNYVGNGIVLLTIQNNNKNYIYKQKEVPFIDGQIQTQLKNNLDIGEYILTAEYKGNKYYQPTTIDIRFTISKRKIKCNFIQKTITGYPNETITTDIKLTDILNNKNIGNKIIYYTFNGNEYTTQTNNQGIATLQFTIPDINPSECFHQNINNINTDNDTIGEFYWDEDGSLRLIEDNSLYITTTNDNSITDTTEESIQSFFTHMYPINVYIDNYAYIIEDFTEYVIVNKYDTDIVIYESFINDSIWYLKGNVVGYNDNTIANVKYGKIYLKINDINYEQSINVKDDGNFILEIDINNIINVQSNMNTATDPIRCIVPKDTIIILDQIPSEIERNYIEKNGLDCTTLVKTTTNEIVQEGMVSFVITDQNNDEVYRYVSELNENGKAYFRFDVSTQNGEYYLQTFYHSMFEYKDSESNIQSFRIINTTED